MWSSSHSRNCNDLNTRPIDEQIFVGLFLVALFSTPSLAESCSPEGAPNQSLMPLPPSIKDLPNLRLIEWNNNTEPITLQCELLLCSITHPITYNWYFSNNVDEPNTVNITSIVQDGEVENFKIEGDKLIFNVNQDGDRNINWGDYTGYYWCTAQNEHGIASSSKCQVLQSLRKEEADDLPPLTVVNGESVHVAMERPPLSPTDVPLDVFYTVTPLDKPDQMQMLFPKDPSGLEGKEGRFVIGDDFDLYIQQATNRDSCKVGQHFREYGALTTTFKHRNVQIIVNSSTFYQEDQSGFFSGYEDYLFVRGKESAYMTCIPREKSRVKFLKDGRELELTYDDNQHVYRTDFAIWFNNPTEDDSGTYTCYKEEDPNVKVTKNLRVIGAPLIECDFNEFIIRTPGDVIKMACNVTSDFLTSIELQIFFNNNPFEPTEINVSYTQTIKKIKNGFKVEIASSKLTDKDEGVFRFVGSAPQMTKEEVMKSMKLDEKNLGQVYFNDYRLLPFTSRQEVSVSVFEMPLRVKPHDNNEARDTLVGHRNFGVRSTIYGSPLPEVTWFVDGQEIDEESTLYAFTTKLSIEFEFIIKNVEKSVNITALALHTINGTVYTVEDRFQITAHEPIYFVRHAPPQSVNTANGRSANVVCNVNQTGGLLPGAASVVITWLKEDGSQIFSGSEGFEINGAAAVINDVIYNIDALTFIPKNDSMQKFTCVARLVIGEEMQHTLQTIMHNVTVKAGEGPKTPSDLQYDARRHLFSFQAYRIEYDYEMMDIVEMAQVFKETEKGDPQWSKLGESHHYVGRGGWYDIKTSLGDLTDYEMETLPNGAKFMFRVYTKNEFGKSGYSNIVETITPDVEPTQDISQPPDD